MKSIYNHYKTTTFMSYLRLGFLIGTLATYQPKRILDVRYGNRNFLKVASNFIKECYGYNINPPYKLPQCVKFIKDIYSLEFDIGYFLNLLNILLIFMK